MLCCHHARQSLAANGLAWGRICRCRICRPSPLQRACIACCMFRITIWTRDPAGLQRTAPERRPRRCPSQLICLAVRVVHSTCLIWLEGRRPPVSARLHWLVRRKRSQPIWPRMVIGFDARAPPRRRSLMSSEPGCAQTRSCTPFGERREPFRPLMDYGCSLLVFSGLVLHICPVQLHMTTRSMRRFEAARAGLSDAVAVHNDVHIH